MAAAVVTALGLDQPEMLSSFISVLENDNADSSFVVSCLIWECLVGRAAREGRATGLLLPKQSASSAVVLLTSHHPASHYRNQCLKLGLNLNSMSQKGLFEEVDLMKSICESFSGQSSPTGLVNGNGTVIVKTLFSILKTKLMKLKENFKSVCLILANVNDMVVSGVSVPQLFNFINYLQGLLSEIDGLSLVVSAHSSDEECERLLQAFLRHASDVTVGVSGLQTGLSKDVSGTLSVSRDLSPTCVYHYRLMDRQIKIFSPGASAV